ncbi:MAG TPA: hypothetical protein DCL35_02060 [Candidatus Omnitrophica bacterium]|nr:hypothetical protein [Candidatus Omnitrophota bacterium]
MSSSVPAKLVKALSTIVTRRLVAEYDRIPYTFIGLSYKKIFNWLAAEASAAFHSLRPWGWPTHLQIEPANLCNLSCALCPISGQMKRQSGHMDLGLFKRLTDEIGDYVFMMFLWDWGEPFLNPSIYEMISYAKEKGIKTASSSNGHLFSDVVNADKVILSGLDTLIVAVDGISQNTYERYRKKGDLEVVLKGIRTLVERKRALGSSTPLINFRFIVMRHNEHEVPRLKEFVRSLGVDVLTIKTLNPCSDDPYGEKENGGAGKINDLSPLGHAYRRFRYAPDGKTLVRHLRNPCKNLWNSATIHHNGVVCPCTYDYDERFPLGDLNVRTFGDIWFSEPYQKMRKWFLENNKDNHFCYECSYAYEGGSCIDETVAEAFFFNK